MIVRRTGLETVVKAVHGDGQDVGDAVVVEATGDAEVPRVMTQVDGLGRSVQRWAVQVYGPRSRAVDGAVCWPAGRDVGAGLSHITSPCGRSRSISTPIDFGQQPGCSKVQLRFRDRL